MYKFGKLPYKHDRRTLQLREVLKAELPSIPDTFNVDEMVGHKIDNPMFANDVLGDCVIAGRAHQTRRFEAYEQGKVIVILDAEVKTEYWKEGGWSGSWCGQRPDNGLVMLDSLKAWAKGWKAAGERYSIYAYGLVDCKDDYLARACMYLLNGAYTGILLPLSAKTQFENGETWDGTDDVSGSWGAHCVYIKGVEKYSHGYVYTCVTWGKLQQMTSAFLARYCDEFWGVIDQKNKADSILDINKLEAYLNKIRGG